MSAATEKIISISQLSARTLRKVDTAHRTQRNLRRPIRASITALPGSGQAAVAAWEALGNLYDDTATTVPARGLLVSAQKSHDIIHFAAYSPEEFTFMFRRWLQALFDESSLDFFGVCMTLDLPDGVDFTPLAWIGAVAGQTPFWIESANDD